LEPVRAIFQEEERINPTREHSKIKASSEKLRIISSKASIIILEAESETDVIDDSSVIYDGSTSGSALESNSQESIQEESISLEMLEDEKSDESITGETKSQMSITVLETEKPFVPQSMSTGAETAVNVPEDLTYSYKRTSRVSFDVPNTTLPNPGDIIIEQRAQSMDVPATIAAPPGLRIFLLI
jgi:hypothetical protein